MFLNCNVVLSVPLNQTVEQVKLSNHYASERCRKQTGVSMSNSNGKNTYLGNGFWLKDYRRLRQSVPLDAVQLIKNARYKLPLYPVG